MQIVFPDYKGAGCTGEFGRTLANQYPNAKILAVVNGLPRPELEIIVQQHKSGLETEGRSEELIIPQNIEPFITEGEGVVESMMDGYAYLLEKSDFESDDGAIVKMDNREHPIQYAILLSRLAETTGAVVIADLDAHAPNFLEKDSLDAHVHRKYFPEMFGEATKDNIFGPLRFSCAYGYQAYPRREFHRIFEAARLIVNRAQKNLRKEQAGEKVKWGWDAAMVLAAYHLEIPIIQFKIQPEGKRDARSIDKILRQANNNKAIIDAAKEVFGTRE